MKTITLYLMRTLILIIPLLCLAAVSLPLATPAAESQEGTKVGGAGDPDTLVFEGLEAFSVGQVRRALGGNAGYLLAAHPQADLQPFLDHLQKKVLGGYQVAGFPDAEVTVRFDTNRFQAHVKVTEGLRFTAGQLRVVGAKSISVPNLVQWFITSADASESTSGLNTPGKATRPEDPIWVTGDPADFSAAWATQALAQVEANLAEQGFFFPQAKVELQRNAASGRADLLITIQDEGPSGVIDQIKVTGQQLHSADDITGFLRLRKGQRLTTERLVEARRKLRNCGRFWYFTIMPEYAREGDKVSSRRVNLLVEVKEQEGVPHLDKPLTPTQQALVRLCEWLEQFPARNEDFEIKVSNSNGIPFNVRAVVSPQHGLLLNSADLQGASPVAAGFLVADNTIQFSAWASGVKIACERGGSGNFFLHLVPADGEGTNRFTLSFGAGYSSVGKSDTASTKPLEKIDVQITRAALLDLPNRKGTLCQLEAGQLVISNKTLMLWADAKSGRLFKIDGNDDAADFHIRFNARAWNLASREFEQRAAPLTNIYLPGQGFTTFLSLAAAEAARWKLTTSMNSSVSPVERTRAVAALRKLLNPEFLATTVSAGNDNETNSFRLPLDSTDLAMAQNELLAFFSGYLFDLSNQLFPKHSWPWTVSREGAFVIMNQGRYTGAELERLCQSEATGPIAFLAIARLLATVDANAAKGIALQGLTRLSAESFLSDCSLFLRGDSGLARGFGKLAEALRALPDDELAALVSVLPKAEANLLRESATALRAQPEATPDSALSPLIAKYWQESLRAKVRASLFQLTR